MENKNNSNRMIYALTGGNGSGKTTYALKIAKEKQAVFFSLDKTIKEFNEVILSYADYMIHFERALGKMSDEANLVLKNGGSVVFDFGGGLSSRPWLKKLAETSGAEIEIIHLVVPREERLRRIQQRNVDKNNDVYFFHMSDEEFKRHNQSKSEAPPAGPGIKVTKVNN